MPFRRRRLIGTKFARPVAKRMLNHVPADPTVEVVGCPNRGVDTVLYRRRGRVGALRSPDGPADCRHGDAPFWLCFSHRSNGAAARASPSRPLIHAGYSTHGPLVGFPTFLQRQPRRALTGGCQRRSFFGSRARIGPRVQRDAASGSRRLARLIRSPRRRSRAAPAAR